ncbi:MAG: acetylornithine/succinylornithine family transaminase [Actinomycetota bacterium]|nr:acetylornithine/succinylornithine family transaminase [Actinomycetota bacterium]
MTGDDAVTGHSSMPFEPAVMPTYRRYPVTLARGDGMYLFDTDGRRYLDFAGALGVTLLGHGHQAWRAAVHEQVDRLELVSNLYATEPQPALAERLAALSGIPEAQVFFSNSGAEANEAAIKLVRKWGLGRGRSKIVALDESFHGRTVATLAATGQPPKRAAFEPLVDWFVHVPPEDLQALDAAITDQTAAVLLEPVLGEGGVRPLSVEYLRAARELTTQRGALLIADEVQSGLGRCGDWLAISFAGVTPDVVSLAKGLGGGLPIGATISRAEIAFAPGDHASTFGGGPIPCAAALAVLDTIEKEDLLANVREQGDRLRRALASSGAREVRGRGLLTGIELNDPIAHEVVLAMLERGLLATEAGESVVRMSPALIAEAQHVDEAAETFSKAVVAVGGGS